MVVNRKLKSRKIRSIIIRYRQSYKGPDEIANHSLSAYHHHLLPSCVFSRNNLTSSHAVFWIIDSVVGCLVEEECALRHKFRTPPFGMMELKKLFYLSYLGTNLVPSVPFRYKQKAKTVCNF